MQPFLSSLLALTLLTGCAFSVTTVPDSSFRMKSTGLGTSSAEAERDAWYDAADRLRAMGYSSFHLDRTGMSTSGSGDRVEVDVDWQVTQAERGDGQSCRCGSRHTDREHNH